MIELLTGIHSIALLAGGVLVLGALGEVLSERVGVFNLGLEGLFGIGGVTAIIVTAHGAPAIIGMLAAIVAAAVFGCVFSAATGLLRANQTLCGLGLTIGGSGAASAIGRSYSGQPARSVFAGVAIPVLSDIPVLGRAVFSQSLLIYVIWIVLALAMHWLLYRTRHGMNLRAVGENPAAADAARDQAELNAVAAIKFVSTASHDIRQPLQATALLLGSLTEDIETERGQATIKTMENSLIASLELLDALLEFSRLDAGALRPSFMAVDVGVLALRVSEPFIAMVGMKGVELHVVPTC